jgi:hypothetical protein
MLNQLICVSSRHGQVRVAHRVAEAMAAAGLEIYPASLVWLVRGLCISARDLNAAVKAISLAQGRDDDDEGAPRVTLSPTSHRLYYPALLLAAKLGNAAVAVNLLGAMRAAHGLAPSQGCINAALSACHRGGDREGAVRITDQLADADIGTRLICARFDPPISITHIPPRREDIVRPGTARRGRKKIQ